MQQKTPLPTRSQILHVRRLLWIGLYEIPLIARLTGVPIRDVFRIEKAFLAEYTRSRPETSEPIIEI